MNLSDGQALGYSLIFSIYHPRPLLTTMDKTKMILFSKFYHFARFKSDHATFSFSDGSI